MKNYIYIVHSIVPSYFASAEKALKYAYATNGKAVYTNANMTNAEVNTAYMESHKRKAVYLRIAHEALRTKGVFRADWQSDFPQIKITREELQ